MSEYKGKQAIELAKKTGKHSILVNAQGKAINIGLDRGTAFLRDAGVGSLLFVGSYDGAAKYIEQAIKAEGK
jgi:hypothetical protein